MDSMANLPMVAIADTAEWPDVTAHGVVIQSLEYNRRKNELAKRVE